MENLMLDIVTPEKKVFEGEIKELIAPGIEGEFGILKGHAPFATILAPGVVVIRKLDNTEDMLAVSGGYIEVSNNKVILLVETAEREDEVDVEVLKRRKEEKEKLLQAKDRKDIDYDKIQSELLRELSRLKAIDLLKKRKKV